ncbi:hypothetical protein ABH900_000171 [Stenotrophomonas sp. AN71]|uniref:hypothetical protein n=1 Tax=Stenotrophomonas sp. AN71 TaxID=3156253 RepID=UPI003D263ABE
MLTNAELLAYETNQAALSAHRFVPLGSTWVEAIRSRFAVAGVATGLNNPGTCAGIGRR